MVGGMLKKISGMDNLKSVSIFRFILGIIFILYGVLILIFIPIKEIWTIRSIALAFFGLGLMFILDGQSILREYFRNNKK